jgi:hypothetical protein
MSSMRYRLRSEDVAWRVLDGEALIVDLPGRCLHTCNESATLIVAGLGSEPTAEDLVRVVCDHYDVDAETARADVTQLLTALEEKGLVTSRSA